MDTIFIVFGMTRPPALEADAILSHQVRSQAMIYLHLWAMHDECHTELEMLRLPEHLTSLSYF